MSIENLFRESLLAGHAARVYELRAGLLVSGGNSHRTGS